MNKQNSEKKETLETAMSETSEKVWQAFLSKIKEKCLDRNFGTLSKSEFDLLLFHYFLLNKQKEVGSRYVSDYEIGRELGLTIQRVRSLRERDALKSGGVGDWKEVFRACLKHAHCDDGGVKILVPDVNVIKEVRQHLESQHLFDEFHLNPKVLQCRYDVLVAFWVSLEDQSEEGAGAELLKLLRSCDDKNVVSKVKEQLYPIRTAIKKAVLLGAKEFFIAQLPNVASNCIKFIDILLKNAK